MIQAMSLSLVVILISSLWILSVTSCQSDTAAPDNDFPIVELQEKLRDNYAELVMTRIQLFKARDEARELQDKLSKQTYYADVEGDIYVEIDVEPHLPDYAMYLVDVDYIGRNITIKVHEDAVLNVIARFARIAFQQEMLDED